MNPLIKLTAREAVSKLRTGEVTPLDLCLTSAPMGHIEVIA